MADQSAEDPRTPSTGRVASELAASLAAAGFEDAREIGRGGFGVVYRCRQVSLGRVVAIKVLASDLDAPNRERFLREGYAMGRLSGHPNIVNILQVGVTDSGRPYIVMPYHRADSLAVRMRREGAIPWPEVLRIGVHLAGALETAHRADTLHRDIKPANVLVNDYGEAQLTDFGIAHIAGGYETATGFFTGTIAYTAPEVLSGEKPTIAADVYSLGATLYALIAGSAAYERRSGEEMVAQYIRISSQPVPDLRSDGIPINVCETIERAMAKKPGDRPPTAAEFGRELQDAQRRNGLRSDSMALTAESISHDTNPKGVALPTERPPDGGPTAGPAASTGFDDQTRPPDASASQATRAPNTIPPAPVVGPPAASNTGSHPGSNMSADPTILTGGPRSGPQPLYSGQNPVYSGPNPVYSGPNPVYPSGPQVVYPSDPHAATNPPIVLPADVSFARPAQPPNPPQPPGPPKRESGGAKKPLIIGALIGVCLLVIASIAWFVFRDKSGSGKSDADTVAAQEGWHAITNARIARSGAATTQSDGTIWIFGGQGDNGVLGAHEGYDPAIDAWKGGDELPTPVMDAASVTWNGNPIVIGGFTAKDASPTANVWRVVDAHWVSLPPLLQPRAAAGAAVVGDKIIVTGGVGSDGQDLSTTEIFDGKQWTLSADLPTPRDHLAAVSDGVAVYALGGSSGGKELANVDKFDPDSGTWTSLPNAPESRSDFGAVYDDGRIVVAGGLVGGKVLNTVAVYDIAGGLWSDLPSMSTARHGLALSSVGPTVYAIGGSTALGDSDFTSQAEGMTLAPRKLQPASQWRSLPDSPAPRLQTAWAVADNKIWVLGGLANGQVLQTVESFDPASGQWSAGPPLPIPLHHATATTYRGEVVILGGATVYNNLAKASDKVFALRGNSWVELPKLKHPRAAPAAAVVGDKLIIAGGQNEKKLVEPTEVFDGSSWSDAAAPPTPREHLAAVSDGKYFYIVGGRFLSSDKNSAAFERFDPETGEWKKLPDMPTPRGSYGATYIDGRIVAVGGEEPTRVLGEVEAYDIADGKWRKLPPLPTPRHALVVAAVGNTIYAIDGANRPTHEGPVATVEALDFV